MSTKVTKMESSAKSVVEQCQAMARRILHFPSSVCTWVWKRWCRTRRCHCPTSWPTLGCSSGRTRPTCPCTCRLGSPHQCCTTEDACSPQASPSLCCRRCSWRPPAATRHPAPAAWSGPSQSGCPRTSGCLGPLWAANSAGIRHWPFTDMPALHWSDVDVVIAPHCGPGVRYPTPRRGKHCGDHSLNWVIRLFGLWFSCQRARAMVTDKERDAIRQRQCIAVDRPSLM